MKRKGIGPLCSWDESSPIIEILTFKAIRTIVALFQICIHFLVTVVNHRKMSSSEDGDLIDLGNDNCVPRVSIQESSSDEQEHLLDVCPPKLEQTLSLTRKQEQIQYISDNGDVLVTLGHDQVVPIRKRIDVVSSDTIKRVRDITRNLEPVIRKTCSDINEEHQDTVDYGNISNHKDGHCHSEKLEDETFETQEINNAFNFLTEHDDSEDQTEAKCNRYDQVINSHGLILLTCCATKNENLLNYHGGGSSQALSCWETDTDLNNSTFELCSGKPSEGTSRTTRSGSVDYKLEVTNINMIKKRSEEQTFIRTAKRGSFQHMHRKSWTEGTTLKTVKQDTFSRFDRSTSLRGYNCAPSTSNGIHRHSSFISRYDIVFSRFHHSRWYSFSTINCQSVFITYLYGII